MLQWFYIDTGYTFKTTVAIQATSTAAGLFHIQIPVHGTFFMAPGGNTDVGIWTLDITGGNGSSAGSLSSSFSVKQGAESKSRLTLTVPAGSAIPKGKNGKPSLSALTSLTLTIGSSTFNVATTGAAPVHATLSKNELVIQAAGLNLIELLSIDMTVTPQTISDSVSVTGIDSGGNTITFFDGAISYKIAIKKGTARGTGAAAE
jgi:hypothetical protein